MHPAILFDLRDPVQLEKTIAAGADILAYCVSVGGTITGEHGVGMEKNNLMPLLFTETDMDVMKDLREAFNRNSILNPQKIFPTTRSCRETGSAAFIRHSGRCHDRHVSAALQLGHQLAAIVGPEHVSDDSVLADAFRYRRRATGSIRGTCFGRRNFCDC